LVKALVYLVSYLRPKVA